MSNSKSIINTASTSNTSGAGAETPPRIKLVLAGNPNVGKSLFFNYLSGSYVDVSNFPGTTVAITKALYKEEFEIFDTPGVYGISSFNDEERVARDTILDGDVIINIVNSLSLDRDMFLTRQLIDTGKPVVVMLNFADELKKRNIKIKTELLSEMLGVNVYLTSAAAQSGFEQIDEAILNARPGKAIAEIDSLIRRFDSVVHSRPHALLIAEGDEIISKRFNTTPGSAEDRDFIYVTRRNHINEVVNLVEYEDTARGRLFHNFGTMSLNPVTGIPILMVILTFMYFFIGDLVSQRLVNFTEKTVGHGIFEFQLKKFISRYTPVTIKITIRESDGHISEQHILYFPVSLTEDESQMREFNRLSGRPDARTDFDFHNTIVKFFFGNYGVISMTITYLVFLLLPLVLAFYFTMAYLEDSGYLPRLATMVDRSLSLIGLNGKAIIPILLGFGCVTMATLTTRILGTNRERTIVTAILQFVIPCSAQLAVITFLMSTAGFVPLLIYAVVIISVLILLSTILNLYLPGSSSPLLLDLPIMQMPRLRNVLKKMYYRTWGFMKEAAVWFFVGAAFIGILEISGWLIAVQDLLAPITTHWLKLPKEAASAFVMGIVRRDFGTAGLFEIPLSPMQKTVAIITITLFVPCIASLMVMLKERGIKEGLLIWLGTWIGAFSIGGLVAQVIVK